MHRAVALVVLLLVTACTGGDPPEGTPSGSPTPVAASDPAQPDRPTEGVVVDEPAWRADLRRRLEADPRVVRATLLTARPSGLFQCAFRWVPSHRHGAVRYGKVMCGDCRTGPDATLTRGSSLPAVLRLTGPPGRRCLVRAEFPHPATMDRDLRRLFPREVLDEIHRLDTVPAQPSEDELLAVARSRLPGFVSAVGRPGAPCP